MKHFNFFYNCMKSKQLLVSPDCEIIKVSHHEQVSSSDVQSQEKSLLKALVPEMKQHIDGGYNIIHSVRLDMQAGDRLQRTSVLERCQASHQNSFSVSWYMFYMSAGDLDEHHYSLRWCFDDDGGGGKCYLKSFTCSVGLKCSDCNLKHFYLYQAI